MVVAQVNLVEIPPLNLSTLKLTSDLCIANPDRSLESSKEASGAIAAILVSDI
jgi:hypothetical protein